MKTINTTHAPEPIGPYSQAIEHNGLLYLSGQIALNPVTGFLEDKDIRKETTQVMENIKAVLHAAGSGLENVIKVSIFLMDMKHFDVVNDVYGCFFDKHFPARETVQVAGLPKGVNVEMSVIAGA